MNATCRCGATWTGYRAEHCTECHRTYSGQSLGDAHRIGEHHPDTRRCLTEAEMTAKGWRLVDAVWRGPAMSDELKAKRFGARA